MEPNEWQARAERAEAERDHWRREAEIHKKRRRARSAVETALMVIGVLGILSWLVVLVAYIVG